MKKSMSQQQQNQQQPQNIQQKLNFHRKTSVEIVSEAKNMLASGGARLVSTRRPITPREPRRQLYGKQAPPGRPPSSFSLRYLQFESRALTLPLLDPLPTTPPLKPTSSRLPSTIPPTEISSKFSRSSSVGTLYDNNNVCKDEIINNNNNSNNNNNNTIGNNNLQAKLPALLSPPKLAGSFDSLSDEMPPRIDMKSITKSDTNSSSSTEENIAAGSKHILITKGSVKKLMKKNGMAKSIDDNDNFTDSESSKSSDKSSKPSKVVKPPPVINKKILLRNNDLLSQSSTETLLDLLKAHAGIKESSDETVIHINGILTELYTRVKGARGEWRCAVLGALYGLVESTSPKILLSVARVVLVLCVTGSNLTGACKLVFKVSRNETNDMLFVDSDVPELLIDGLGRASPLDEPEACIYGYGAVRFLANATIAQPKDPITNKTTNQTGSGKRYKQKSLAQRLARHGAVQLMVLHLQMLNEAGATSKLTGPPLHALFQLSGALRVLAKIPSIIALSSESGTLNLISQPSMPASLFSNTTSSATTTTTTNTTTTTIVTTTTTTTTSNKNNNKNITQPCPPQIQELYEEQDCQLHLACPHLVRSAEICITETEVQTNIIRTLSVMSEHSNCCESLADYSGRLGILLGPCDQRIKSTEKPLSLLIRLGYILGNIMAKYDLARSQFFYNDVAMEYLLSTLEYFAGKRLNNSNPTGGANGTDTIIDVLIKFVRVIANMSVNDEVGFGLGKRPIVGSVLLSLLITANNFKLNLSLEMEELLLATLGALHNLSFYHDAETETTRQHPSSMIERLSDLTSALCQTLTSGPQIARPEAARVLGNMTRSSVARISFCSVGGLKILVKNLESDDSDLVATSCGVLVNLLSDWERRAPFRELRGPYMLRDVLQRSAMNGDWQLAGIVCQALWNYLIDTTNIIGALGEDEADYIAGDLVEYLDEEVLFNGETPDNMWERFAIVAADLLERIQSSISYTASPCDSTDEDDNIEPSSRIGTLWQGEHFKTWLQEEN